MSKVTRRRNVESSDKADGGILERARWLWNGGASEKPTVTDFVIATGKITVRHLEGSRKALPEMITGKDGDLKVTGEYVLSAKGIEESFSATKFDRPLTASEKQDLANLEGLVFEFNDLEAAKKE